MRSTLRSSGFTVALLAGALALFGCGRASAGYLPAAPSEPRNGLFACDSDSLDLPQSDRSSSCAPVTQPTQVEPDSTPDQPDGPLAHRASLSVAFALLGGRSRSGNGGTGTRSDSGSSSQPCGWISQCSFISPAESWQFLHDSSVEPPASPASRLFRPPR
ncbi:MAG: hypothetical protein ACJ8F7_19275 [Gemmataceae bacterium]